MENKLKLNLCANYSKEALKSAVCNSILCDYIIDKLGLAIKRFNKEDLDLFYIYENFKIAIEKSSQITYSNIVQWEENKVSSYQDCLNIVVVLDGLAADAGKISAGELIEEFQQDCQEYGILLSAVVDVEMNEIKFGQLKIKEEFLTTLKNQLTFVDEGQFLSDLGTMQIEMIPLDTNKYRNRFVEKKLKKINDIHNSVKSILLKDFEKLHDDIAGAYDRFYKIIYAALSDGEKVDASRKVYRLISPHKQVLDKLENKLTEANELKRQLVIHEKSLKNNLNEKLEEFKAILEEKPYEEESINREIDGITFVTDEYIEKIHNANERINTIEQEISDKYDILDRLDNALKAAIPSENEMKRYSNLSFKFEDLYVRLELAKSQLKSKDKQFVDAINTAVIGLGVLINLGIEGKDIYLRNSLLSAVFNSVNGMYDIVDNKNKSVELSQIKFVTSRLVKYSILNSNLNKDLQTFRRVCNNAIRDIAMMMGKPFSIGTMLDIVDTIDLAIKQVQELVDTLNHNHVEQTSLLGDILNI